MSGRGQKAFRNSRMAFLGAAELEAAKGQLSTGPQQMLGSRYIGSSPSSLHRLKECGSLTSVAQRPRPDEHSSRPGPRSSGAPEGSAMRSIFCFSSLCFQLHNRLRRHSQNIPSANTQTAQVSLAKDSTTLQVELQIRESSPWPNNNSRNRQILSHSQDMYSYGCKTKLQGSHISIGSTLGRLPCNFQVRVWVTPALIASQLTRLCRPRAGC